MDGLIFISNFTETIVILLILKTVAVVNIFRKRMNFEIHEHKIAYHSPIIYVHSASICLYACKIFYLKIIEKL